MSLIRADLGNCFRKVAKMLARFHLLRYQLVS